MKQVNDMLSRIKILGLLLALTLGLTSCGPKGPPLVKTLPLEYVPTPVNMPVLSEVHMDCPQVSAMTDPNITTITWMVPDAIKGLDKVISAFEKAYPKIHVEILAIQKQEFFNSPQNKNLKSPDYFMTSTNLLQAGCTAPDVLNVKAENSAYYASYGWLASIWNQYTFDEKEDWIQALRKNGRYAREQYTAPFDTSTSLLFYNSDLLQKAGITPPGEDDRWTWEQVASAAKKLTVDENKDGKPEVWGFAWESSTTRNLVVLPESLGGEAIGLDGVTVKGVIDLKPWQDAFIFYSKIFNEWKVSPKDETYQPAEAFLAGKLALMVGRAENINNFASSNFSWGVSRYPYFKKGVVVVPTGNWQIGVNPKTTHYDAAMTLVHWLTFKVGGEVLWREGSVTLPAEKNVLALFAVEPSFNTTPQSYWKTAAKEALVFTLPGPITPFYQMYDEQLQKAFRDIRSGADPKTTLANLADILADLFK